MTSHIKADEREVQFTQLSAAARACTLCPRMAGRTRVLSALNGSIYAQVMFVAEAPGRLGADRTGIPLHDDVSGRNFERLLASIAWQREDVFVTNAVLCNPRDEQGRNVTPTRRELHNCNTFLRATIDLIQPRIIVTLGATALWALGQLAPHTASLSCDVATALPWYDRYLFPLYHPGPRALIKRNFARQLEDYARLADFSTHL
jgi:uracil-DNA glycosylase family 4